MARRELQLLESLASENSRLLELNTATANLDRDVMPAEIINIAPDPFSKRVLITEARMLVYLWASRYLMLMD